jgi:hypothetical protein
VADDEREAERTVTRTTESTADPDRAADSFLELESELDVEDAPETGRTTGLVVDAATVPAAEVPASYPVDVTTTSVLALTLDTAGGREVTAYLEWPDDGVVEPSSRLGRLLAAAGVSADDFADLYGRTLLLERTGEHVTVFVPPEQPRGHGDWSLGVAAGLTFNVATFGLAALAAAGLAPVPSGFVALFTLVNLFLLPYATYRDATYLRSHSDWEQGPPFWAALSMVAGLNVLVSALYLRSRRNAWFLDDEPSLSTRLVRRVRDLL